MRFIEPYEGRPVPRRTFQVSSFKTVLFCGGLFFTYEVGRNQGAASGKSEKQALMNCLATANKQFRQLEQQLKTVTQENAKLKKQKSNYIKFVSEQAMMNF
jgi:hypothetical protein